MKPVRSEGELTMCKARRGQDFRIHQNSDESWNKAILTIVESREISENFKKLKELDPELNLENEVLNYIPNTPSALSSITNIVLGWKELKDRNGTIPNLIGRLIVLGFEETASTLASLINNDGNQINYDISFRQQNNFYGRKDGLEQLQKFAAQTNIRQVNKIAITGSFGIGKSSLALQFVNKFQEMFDGNVIWLNSESAKTLERQFLSLAKTLCIPTSGELKVIINECYDYFQWTRSLFVFDNAEGYNEISDFLPSKLQKFNSVKPFILITSRDMNSWFMKNISTLVLDALSASDSLDFLYTELYGIDITEQDLSELAGELGYYPLEMRLACVVITNQYRRKKRLNRPIQNSLIQEYLTNYRKMGEDYPKTKNCSSEDYSVRSCLELIYPTLKEKIKPEDEDAYYKTLTIISYGAPDCLPKILFRDLNYGDTCDDVSEVLENYSILYSKDEYFTIHRPVQKAFQSLLPSTKGHKDGKELLGRLIQDINNLIRPIKNNVQNFKDIKSFLRTFESFSSHIAKFGIIKEQIEFIQTVWHFYNVMDYPSHAYEYSSRILDQLPLEEASETDLSYLQMRFSFGVSLIYQYRPKEACETLGDLYTKCQRPELGKTHPLTMEIGIWLAFILGRIGKFLQSEQLYTEILNLSPPLSSDPIHKIRARSGLADLQKCMGKYSDSMSNFELSHQEAILYLGPDNCETYKIQYLICSASLQIEQLREQAYKLIMPMTKLIKDSFGLKSLSSLKCCNLFSGILMKLEKFREAKSVIEEILPRPDLGDIVPECNPVYLEIIERLSLINQHLKLVEVGETLQIQLDHLEIKSKVLLYDNQQPSVIESHENIADSYRKLRNYAEAKNYLEIAYKSRKLVFGRNNPLTQNTKVQLDKMKIKLESPKPVDSNTINILSPPSSQSDGETEDISQEIALVCNNCLKPFKSMKTLKKHIRDKHTRKAEQRPICPNCGTRLYDNYGVKRHQDSCKKKPTEVA